VPAALSLPVPALFQQNVAAPYAATATITVNRSASFTGPIALSLDPSQLPAGVQAEFVDATLAAGATVAGLRVQAGSTDPASTSVTFPAPGSYAIPITASAPGSPSVTGTLTLSLVPEANDFALSLFAAGQTPTDLTSLNLMPGVPLVEPFEAYWTQGDYTSFGPVALSVQGVPEWLTVTVDGTAGNQAINLNQPHSLIRWAQLLSEMITLRTVDGSQANYYGFINPGITAPFGIDETGAGWFENADPGLDLPTLVMVHEEGHAFNLNHAPAGGAGNPQLNYPYLEAAIGSWGFDPAALAAHDPTREFDIMSYAQSRHWVSDWNYRNAMAFLDEIGLAPAAGAPASDEQWVVSGWVGPDGQAHLSPLVRIHCAPRPALDGPLRLRLKTAGGTRAIPFAAAQVPDLPPGHRHFFFTVPAAGELSSAEIRVPGGRSCRLARTLGLAARAGALDAAARDGSLVVREAAGSLHLEWDARLHPYVSVIHQGERRTTLGLHLTGGSADLSLAGLPEGGRFVIHYSDGLNPVVRVTAR
jgi:hypothetical protein